MLIDLLNPDNYIMINREAARVFGITTAMYCTELAAICEKAKKKNKMFNETFFKVDRDYIQKRTFVTPEEQLKCDAKLQKLGIVEPDVNDVDLICLNQEAFATIIACEDISIKERVATITEKVKGSKRTTKKEYQIKAVKESIDCRDIDIKFALFTWIDSMNEAGKFVTTAQAKIFKDKLDDYCNGDKTMALELINIAVEQNYVNFDWCVNTRNRTINISRSTISFAQTNEQKITTNISKEVY